MVNTDLKRIFLIKLSNNEYNTDNTPSKQALSVSYNQDNVMTFILNSKALLVQSVDNLLKRTGKE